MTILRTTLIATAMMMGTASLSTSVYAQDMDDKAKNVAVKEGKKVVKKKANEMATDAAGETGGMASDAAVDMGADMMQGKSAKDAAMGVAMDSGKSEAKGMMGDTVVGDTMATEAGKMDGEDMMTAGKVMVKGGSAEDAAVAVAKDRAKDAVMDKAEHMAKDAMHKGMGHSESKPTSAPMTAPAPAATPVNCPSGTTAQSNGTCMITGDYNG